MRDSAEKSNKVLTQNGLAFVSDEVARTWFTGNYFLFVSSVTFGTLLSISSNWNWFLQNRIDRFIWPTCIESIRLFKNKNRQTKSSHPALWKRKAIHVMHRQSYAPRLRTEIFVASSIFSKPGTKKFSFCHSLKNQLRSCTSNMIKFGKPFRSETRYLLAKKLKSSIVMETHRVITCRHSNKKCDTFHPVKTNFKPDTCILTYLWFIYIYILV